MYPCGLCGEWVAPWRAFALTHGYVCAECVNGVHEDLTRYRTTCDFFRRETDGTWSGKQSPEAGFVRVEQAVIVECDTRIAARKSETAAANKGRRRSTGG